VLVEHRKREAGWSVCEPAADEVPARLWDADLGLPDPRRGLLRRRRAREPMTVSPAVRRAVERAYPKDPTGPVGVRELLLELLGEDDTRAAEVLTTLGTSPAAVQARLAGSAHPAPALDADATGSFARAVLLGRATWRPAARSWRLAVWMMNQMVGWAEFPPSGSCWWRRSGRIAWATRRWAATTS
jgi:hypothetical protein